MNELMRINNNDVTPYSANDGWDAVPASDGGMIRGALVKFADGHFFIDKSTEAADDREMAVVGVVTLWIKWVGNKPDPRVTQPGQRHPDRDEWGDLDPEAWEAGLDGKPKDPWQDTRYLYLVDPRTGEELTLTTASAGGRKAIADLKNQIANVRQAHPAAIPIVRLECGTWKTRFGPKPKPLFRVIGWKQGGASGELGDQVKAPRTVNNPAPADAGATDDAAWGDPETTKKSIQQEMDDEIPF
jgi:hypothetical protein